MEDWIEKDNLGCIKIISMVDSLIVIKRLRSIYCEREKRGRGRLTDLNI